MQYLRDDADAIAARQQELMRVKYTCLDLAWKMKGSGNNDLVAALVAFGGSKAIEGMKELEEVSDEQARLIGEVPDKPSTPDELLKAYIPSQCVNVATSLADFDSTEALRDQLMQVYFENEG